jgi:CRP-like cAMP-binding protein
MASPLIRNLERFGPLSAEDRKLLGDAPTDIRNVAADQDIVTEGDIPTSCVVILEGFACRYKLLANGKRSITNFLVAGDICDLQSLLLQKLDHSIGTLTPCRIGSIPHALMTDIIENRPRITRAMWQATLVEGAVFRAWLTNVGRRSGYERIAHLICEMLLRLKVVGLADDGGYDLPLTQAEIGDALGLSLVHVNRILQELRAAGLITFRGGAVQIRDWPGLQEAANFDPVYLHIPPQNQAAEIRALSP